MRSNIGNHIRSVQAKSRIQGIKRTASDEKHQNQQFSNPEKDEEDNDLIENEEMDQSPSSDPLAALDALNPSAERPNIELVSLENMIPEETSN